MCRFTIFQLPRKGSILVICGHHTSQILKKSNVSTRDRILQKSLVPFSAKIIRVRRRHSPQVSAIGGHSKRSIYVNWKSETEENLKM